MDKTNIDSMLIEMISPKIKEIEIKFGKGEGLTQEDINTLLLKSQYNHINHLDQKLNEITDNVASLKGEFDNKFNGLKGEFDNKFSGLKDEFDNKFNGLKGEFDNKFSGLKGEFDNKFSGLKGEFDNKFNGLKGEFNDLKGEFNDLKGEFNDLKGEFRLLRSEIETTIQKALNKNMLLLIAMMGFFLTLSKVLDQVLK